MKNLWWGTEKEKISRDPGGSQWRPYSGGDITFICLFWGAGRSRNGPSWFLMATGALFPIKEAALKTMKSQLPVPFLFLGGASARAYDAYLGSADLWNEVIREVESLWYNYLCILCPLFSWRMTSDPHASYVVGTAVGRRNARCRLLCGYACPSQLLGGAMDVGGSPSKAGKERRREERREETLMGTLSHTSTYTHVCKHTAVLTKPAVFHFLLVGNH